MITSDTVAILETIEKLRPALSAAAEAFGQDVVNDLLAKGLISADNPDHCTMTDYARTEISKHRDPSNISKPQQPTASEKPSIPKQNTVHFSAFCSLCCAAMALIAIAQIVSMGLEFNSDFVFAESISIVTIQYTAIQIPHHVCICLGTLLYWVAVCTGNKKLSLTSVILFTCSFFCWPSIYVGLACVPVFVLGIIGYARSKEW